MKAHFGLIRFPACPGNELRSGYLRHPAYSLMLAQTLGNRTKKRKSAVRKRIQRIREELEEDRCYPAISKFNV
ncbi:hypothetical protein KY289_018605 [Solanum tuberosum]|nr:hypothetical protein KY289_018605 [Solanum tuberosum]